ncbi:arylsulfatase [Novosphingobium sp. ZN18A2]|uniref:arylsulfatase n=1 Tax=Novosphingobium sp. ZN18A2 TaxID=3079861 RepID=UPI0030CB58B0
MRMLPRILAATGLALVAAATASAQHTGAAGDQARQQGVDRSVWRPSTVLPRPGETWHGTIGRTIQTSSAPYYKMDTKAPPGAPNILLIMTDDVGFGASSTFGGPVPTATFDALAKVGERYNRFNTTALCAPTRASLLTGREPHTVGFGAITEMGTGYPGYSTVLPKSAATIGEVFRDNGYATSWFGKNHNTPEWEQSAVGPFDRWPNGLGFDYFYGFMGGATNQWNPSLFENHTPVQKPANDPHYILDHDLADHAIAWLRTENAASPDKPFLLYYAPGTSHSPHHAPADWIAKFKGKFDMGWDKMREQTLARQIALGVVPKGTRLSPRPAGIPAWDSLSPQRKRVYAHMMEVYAAALSYADNQIGRVIGELKAEGKFDNTLVIYIQGDNGGSGEGGPEGSINDIASINGFRADLATMIKAMPDLGGPKYYNNYPVGWAWAMNTPFQWTKQVASHLGGIRNGMVISWPKRIRAPGGLRPQFAHVSDIAPTLYEAAGIPIPTSVDGIKQQRMDGISLAYSFNHPDAPSRRTSQVFEMQGNAAWYQDGWFANTTPTRPPWDFAGPGGLPTEGKWQLYDLNTDFSQSQDLAAKYPEKLARMKAHFWQEAARDDILPIDNRSFARWRTSNRPSLLGDRSRFVFYPSDRRITGGAFPDLSGRSWSVDIKFTVPDGKSDGTLVENGSRAVGWGVFIVDGCPVFIHKASDDPADFVRVAGPDKLQPGQHVLSVRVTKLSGGKGEAELTVDGGSPVTEAIPHIVPVLIPDDAETGWSFADLTGEGRGNFRFPGKIDSVAVSRGDR